MTIHSIIIESEAGNDYAMFTARHCRQDLLKSINSQFYYHDCAIGLIHLEEKVVNMIIVDKTAFFRGG